MNLTSGVSPTDIFIFVGNNFTSAIGLSLSDNASDKTFINAYNHNQYVCMYSFDDGSEWYAYEYGYEFRPELPAGPIEITEGKVKYLIHNPQYIQEATAVGVISGNFSLDGLEIADYIIHDGERYPVTSISNNAFMGISGFSGELKIGNNVSVIFANAFNGCSGFTGSLVLPESLVAIDNNAFNGCSGFTGTLNLPKSLNGIGSGVFSGCRGFTGSLVFPESVTSIGQSAFSGCSGFTGSLVLPESVTSIGQSAFNGCSGFTGSLVLPESVTSIGQSAFSGCTGFTGSLVLPESLKSIGGSAFSNCRGLAGSLEIPSGITVVEGSVFSGCSGLNGTLSIPATVTQIDRYAFQGTNFDKVISYGLTPPECSSVDPFSGARKHELQVSGDALTAYMMKSPWNEFENICSIEPLSAIEFVQDNVVCPLGGTVKLKVEKFPFGAVGEISFISSNSAVASVDANGVVTGVAKGSAAIIAMCGTLTATCIVTVEDPTIAASGLEMEGIVGNVGESVEIRAKVIPADVTDPMVSWFSSNPEVAEVDAEGVVWFNAAGNTIVTAQCQGHEFSVPFVVEEVMARSLNVFPVEAVGSIGHEFCLLALHEPDNTTDKSVTWESSDPDVASVTYEGRVTLASLGSAQITARSGEHTAVCSVTVNSTVGLTEIASTGVSIDIIENGIVVRNALIGESIAVYTIDGKAVNGAIIEGEETHLSLAAGIYVVKVSPATIAKVRIK